TAEVVTYFGARPVLCDSVSGGFNLDPEDVLRRITPRTKAIVPVHIAGEPCDLDRIKRIAQTHNLHVIEDAAHSLPATYRGRRIGTISELTAFSFYATKTITTAEGGMLVTDNPDYARRASMMRLHGISGDAWKRYSKEGSWYYEVVEPGYKLNLPDLLAAVGREQLKRCDNFWRARQSIAQYYRDCFGRYAELECPPLGESFGDHAWHLFILRVRPGMLALNRNEFIEQLHALGVGTSVHFIPLHRHPLYASRYGYSGQRFPHADDAFTRALSLPIYPGMTSAQVERVAEAVETVVSNSRRCLWAVAN
ncbi:MAG TPA: DegT/DnrJ/EryC1/StrS family aminotransferase, partial [Terriglobales bacterium]